MTFRFDVRVYFEDTDFSGRVYHGAFVRFLERGRTEMLRAAGLDHRALALRDPPLYFTLRGLRLSFRGPAFIDDLLTVVTAPARASRAALVLPQAIARGSETIVEGEVELCLIDPGGRPRRLPPDIRTALAAPAGG
jgi:acyl-CoA thioester hydrolase